MLSRLAQTDELYRRSCIAYELKNRRQTDRSNERSDTTYERIDERIEILNSGITDKEVVDKACACCRDRREEDQSGVVDDLVRPARKDRPAVPLRQRQG